MRTAITTQLKEIEDFEDRVYQAFTAPIGVEKPYCTFKLGEDNPSMENKLGAFLDLQIFIYNSPSSFTTLDALAIEVRNKLDKVTLTIDGSPERYFRPEYVKTLQDWHNEIDNTFMKRVDFTIPLSR